MHHPPYKNLIIIGNGFDRWQELPTSYDEFRKFYRANIGQVMEQLRLPYYMVTDADGEEKQVTPVELIYGTSLYQTEMPDEFFWTFEDSMDKIDDQQINIRFGRSKDGIEQLQQAVQEAKLILQTVFCNWILALDIEKKENIFCFPKDCFFINFNYTDTLQKRFGIEDSRIYYIHGNAGSPDSIIVGHASHPETAFSELTEQHFMKSAVPGRGLPRIQGLYAVEDVLYQTDKHVEDNIDALCVELFRRGVHIEDFENIYVLGHSFSEPDMEYFSFLDKVTRCGCNYDSLSAAERLDKALFAAMIYGGEEAGEELLFTMIKLNLMYAVHHRNRTFAGAESFYPELDKIDEAMGITYPAEDAAYAVKQRFLFEQSNRTQELLKKLAGEKGIRLPEGCHSVLSFADFYDMGHEQRKRNAMWHISYLSDEDEQKIKRAMKRMGLKRYKLYHGIDKTLEKL